MFQLSYFLLTVVALTAVWAKGSDLLSVFASWQVRATVYQHILIKKSIENIHHAFRVSLGRAVATEVVLCGCTPQSLVVKANTP